jgi:choline dehydrogenase
VLLLETGYSDHKQIFSRIPAAFWMLFHGSADYNFYTEEQAQLNQRKLFWPRGKMLGGCSSMNAMIYHRCAPEDYDRWAELVQDNGWSYRSLLPYFKRSETLHPSPTYPLTAQEMQSHGTEGPWHISYPAWSTPATKNFIRACSEAGIEHVPDINNAERGSLGVTRFMTATYQGKRTSANTSYLTSVELMRPNLVVAVGCKVHKIETAQVNGGLRAVGVVFKSDYDKKLHYAAASTEVILSAGAVHSPQVLMLSGIGPQEHLKEHGIPVVKHMPGVGQSLMDHLFVPLVYKTKPGTSVNDVDTIPTVIPEAIKILSGFGVSKLQSNIGEAGAFFRVPAGTDPQLLKDPKLKDAASSSNAPHLEIIFGAGAFIEHGAWKPRGDYVSLVTILLNPLSRGEIRLKSAKPSDAPLIEARYLTHDVDTETLVDGVLATMNIARQPALRRIIVEENNNQGLFLPDSTTPNGMGQEWTRDKVRAWVRESGETLYHPTSTCKMGLRSDPMAVVDTQCKVYGIQGLRVVDASVFPVIPGGHTFSPVVAVTERIVDLIRSEHRLPARL